MKSYFQKIKQLLQILFILLVLFSLARLFFLIVNYGSFAPISFSEIVKIFLVGSRFDFTIIFYANILFFLFFLLPVMFTSNAIAWKIIKWCVLVVNSVLLLGNLADSCYFQFTKRRATGEILSDVVLTQDFATILPQYLSDFWFVPLVFTIFVVILVFTYPKWRDMREKRQNWRIYGLRSLLMFLIVIVLFVLARGFGLKPVVVTSASKYVDIRYVPVVLNTPFTVMFTLGKEHLEIKHYFTDDELTKIYDPVTQFQPAGEFRKKNVVIIILESFSKEYIASLHGDNKLIGYTPFLDSLISQSLTFEKSYSNGKQSFEALSSVLAGMPTLMEGHYISSLYAANRFNSMASILKEKGYHSAFFHGGRNGTMSFDEFVKLAGFDEYYGKNEYPDPMDFDGNWGIYDEPFFQFFSDKLSSFKEPFLGCIFTLSSHHPYSIPAKYKGIFPKGTLDIHESIGYTDFALQRFFETASKTEWFKNTLFVITADHTSQVKWVDNDKKIDTPWQSDSLKSMDATFRTQATSEYYNSLTGIYAVPIIFYQPADTIFKGRNTQDIIQHIDIMPSVLQYLNYDKKFIAFGKSIFQPNQQRFVINNMNGIYQLVMNQNVLFSTGETSIAFYDLANDRLLKNNILASHPKEFSEMDNFLKAIIQSYNSRMIENKLSE